MTEHVSPQRTLEVASASAPVREVERARYSGGFPVLHDLSRMSVTAPVHLQAELTIGAPDDPLEREADDVADAVMRMPDSTSGVPQSGVTPGASAIQRACATCDEEDKLQAKPLEISALRSPSLQREGASGEEEEESLQASSVPGGVVTASNGLVASGAVAAQVAAARQGGAPLSSVELGFFQPRLAYDLSSVRVHSGPQAATAAASVGARAFTVGPDIVYGAGQPGAETDAGRRLLAHELTHVVQQGHARALRREGED